MLNRGQLIALPMGAIFLSFSLAQNVTANTNTAQNVAKKEISHITQQLIQQSILITRGTRRGQLTEHETKTLWKEQKHIRHTKRIFRKDNVLNTAEQKTLMRMLAIASKNIKRELNDDEKRPRLSKHSSLHH